MSVSPCLYSYTHVHVHTQDGWMYILCMYDLPQTQARKTLAFLHPIFFPGLTEMLYQLNTSFDLRNLSGTVPLAIPHCGLSLSLGTQEAVIRKCQSLFCLLTSWSQI